MFNSAIIAEARKPLPERYLFICVAVRGLEAWYLADPLAITNVLPKSNYAVPAETGDINAGGMIDELWRQQHGNIAFNKLDFAKSISSVFDPENAKAHSASFQLFWNRIMDKAVHDNDSKSPRSYYNEA